jgi:hypothetical protein
MADELSSHGYGESADIRSDLLQVYRYNVPDAYQAARELDNAGWACDAALVEHLQDFDHYEWSAELTAVKAWVAASMLESIRPEIGAKVTLEVRVLGVRQPHLGEVVRIDEESAQATVCFESLGHVKKGLGTRGMVVDWEVIAAAVGAL